MERQEPDDDLDQDMDGLDELVEARRGKTTRRRWSEPSAILLERLGRSLTKIIPHGPNFSFMDKKLEL
ncbi:hypothetical protein DY000_02061838 [Brassica cretica]|uniref:Uncharacterized protein n=1 Tax=Brassica cretica TaxID=69181 RepID=A0ABQ7AWN7_BRACR|nr:hypothetical protein DY000_02061838 [Brassica cretica]